MILANYDETFNLKPIDKTNLIMSKYMNLGGSRCINSMANKEKML